MSKTRFTPWVVLACIATLAGCTSGEDGTVGNTELNVVIPSSDGSGFDIEVVEYTINCDATPPTAADFPGIDSIEPTFDPDVTINGALEVLDTASSGVTTQDFGPDLSEVYVWQDFMDIPLEAICTVQLRARDAGGEVICTATEPFDTNTVPVGGVVKVNVLMYCGVSFQAPVASLDVDGDFSFNIANFCPDLFVLNCIDPDLEQILAVPGLGAFAYSGCQVRFRDGDSQCGTTCDPQTCTPDAEGLTCTPGPDPGVSTTVTCDSPGFFCAIPNPAFFGTPCTPAPGDFCFDNSGGVGCAPASVLNCQGAANPVFDPFCEYMGDTLGTIGGAPPNPLAPGEGSFLVGCTVADDDGLSSTPPVPLAPGATVTCTAVTTDGDNDCDKTKTVEVKCPGLSPCQAAGPGFCDDGNDCTANSCDDSSGVAVCTSTNVADGTTCTSAPAPATCQAGVCTSANCNVQIDPDGSCDDGNECTVAGSAGSCLSDGSCDDSGVAAGTSCAGGTGKCNGANGAAAVCVDNCVGQSCSDGKACTDDVCTSGNDTFTCTNPADDTNSCTTCPSGTCVCSGGSCIDGTPPCTVPTPQNATGIPMACRNSFNQAVSTFPIDLLNVNTQGSCIEDGQAVNFGIDPVIALDTAFLQAAAQTLCDLGTFLTTADVTSAQVSIDAVAGATCTQQLAVLSPVPQTVVLDISIVGTCGSGGVVTVNSGIAVPLPPVNLPCTAGAAGGKALQLCSTGTVPLAISLTVPAPPPAYTETYVGVAVGGGAIQVAFACNTSSTTNPAPGVEVGCILANPAPSTPSGLSCEQEVGAGDVGETPFPISDCNTADGPPTIPQTCDLFGNPSPCSGTCDTVGVGVDPVNVCAVFDVQP